MLQISPITFSVRFFAAPNPANFQKKFDQNICLDGGYCNEILLESGKDYYRLRHIVHSPNQASALMQSDKGRPASGVARFEECSLGIGKTAMCQWHMPCRPDGVAAFANAKVLTRGIAVGSQGFYDYVKGLFASFWPLKKNNVNNLSAPPIHYSFITKLKTT